MVKLDGEWEFYWQKLLMPEDFVKVTDYLVNRHLINIPRSWSGYEIDGQPIEGEGYATFRLRVLLPENGQPLSLNLSSIYTSHKLWVNGQLVSTLGEVSINRESCVPKYFPQIIPLKLDGDSAELILQVANFSHRRGGIWRSVALGNSELIQGIRERQIVYDMVLLGSLLILGLYHLALFSLRKKNKAPLFFALFCLFMALRISLVGEMLFLKFFPQLPQELALKLEYFTFYLGIPLFIVYLCYLFPDEISKKIGFSYLLIGGLYSVHVLLTPFRIYNRLLYSFDIITICFLIYVLIKTILAVIRKREGAVLVVLGFAFFVGTAINDMLYYSDNSPVGDLFPIGALIFVFAQAYILSSRFSKAFDTVEKMSEKLITMDKVKDQFLASVSHELLTPLNGMVGLAESVLGGAKEELSPQQRNYLFLIISSGRRLSRLIDDLLDFSRMKNNDIQLQVKPVNLRQVVQVVLTLSRPLAANKNLELINDVPEDLPLVQADESRLHQILHNLIANGIKFTHEGKVRVSALRKGNFVEIIVADTGIGIPPERQAKIFDSFEQVP